MNVWKVGLISFVVTWIVLSFVWDKVEYDSTVNEEKVVDTKRLED